MHKYFLRNSRRHKLENKKGFGIIEVLVAVGLLAIVSLGFMAMFQNATKSQRGIQAKDIQREVMGEISSHLIDRNACFNSFGGSNPAVPFTKAVIKDALNAAKYTTGTNHNSNLLQYTEFKVQDWVADAGFPNQGRANLNVTLTKLGDIIGAKLIQQKIGLRIKLDGANNILECYSIGSSTDSLWKPTPSNISNIYYDVGNVGIGTNNPGAKLDVAGGIRPGNANIGAACAPNPEGTFAYDMVAHKPVYCNNLGVWTASGAATIQSINCDKPVGRKSNRCCVTLSDRSVICGNVWGDST